MTPPRRRRLRPALPVWAEGLEPRQLLSADLVPLSLDSPGSATSNSVVTVSWTAKNQGDLSTFPSTWSDKLYLSTDATLDPQDRLVGEAAVSQVVAPGQNYSVSSTQAYLSGAGFGGNVYLILQLNALGDVHESSDANNFLAVPLTILVSDLVVTATSTPATLTSNSNAHFSMTVQNQGANAATGYWYETLALSSDTVFDAGDAIITSDSSRQGLSLAPNGQYTFAVDAEVPAFASGSQYLLFIVNAPADDLMAESNTANNVVAVPVTVVTPDVDLTVTALSAPDSATMLNSITVNWTGTNQGSDAALGAWRDGVFLSTDDVLSPDDVSLAESFGSSPLSAGGHYSKSSTFSVPLVAPGSYYLLVDVNTANPYFRQAETNTGNNLSSRPITIIGPDVDLVMTPDAVTGVLIPGSDVTLGWTVSNAATAGALGNWYDEVYLSDDTTLDSGDLLMATLAAGSLHAPLAGGAEYEASLTRTVPLLATAGSKYLLFVTDSPRLQTQPDTNRANNLAAVAVTVGGFDLTLHDLSTPDKARIGGQADVSYFLKNNGPDAIPASYPITTKIYLSADNTFDPGVDTLLDSVAGPDSSLANNTSDLRTRTLSFGSGLAAGDYRLFFVIDPLNNYPDSNKSNNVFSVPLTLTLPDLENQDLTSPDTAAVGQSIDLGWSLANTGGVAAPSGGTARVYLSHDATLDNDDLSLLSVAFGDQIAAGGSVSSGTRSVTIPSVTPGDWYLLIVADAEGDVAETDETNNVLATAITITPHLPVASDDAVVVGKGSSGATILPLANDSGYAPGTPALTITQASQPASGTVTVAGDGQSLLFVPAAGFTGETTITYTLRDTLNRTAQATVTVLVTDKPDLTATLGGSTLPPAAVPGDKGKITVTLANGGFGAVSAKSSVLVYASLDDTLDENDVLIGSLLNAAVKLKPGATQKLSVNLLLPGSLPAGAYRLLAKIDSGNSVDEFNESNNVASLAAQQQVVWKFGDFSGRKGVKLTLLDGESRAVTFALTGGTGEVTGGSDFSAVTLTGTGPNSAFSITGKSASTVGSITANGGLKSIDAKGTSVSGDITPGGTLAAATLAGFRDGVMTIGAGAGKAVSASLKLGVVAEASIVSLSPIASLAVTSWTDATGGRDAVSAPSLAKLQSVGGFGADVTTSSTSAASMGTVTIGGAAEGARFRSAGGITGFTAGALRDSWVFAGVFDSVASLPELPGDFGNPQASIGKLTVAGIVGVAEPSFVGSFVAAWKMGSVSLKKVDSGVGGANGLTADSVGSYQRVTESGALKKLSKLSAANTPDEAGAFRLKVL